MILILRSTSGGAMSCYPHSDLSGAVALFVDQDCRFNGSKFGNEEIEIVADGLRNIAQTRNFAKAEWLNPNLLLRSGRCRTTLAPV